MPSSHSLLYEHQIAAIKDVYNGTIDMKAIATKYACDHSFCTRPVPDGYDRAARPGIAGHRVMPEACGAPADPEIWVFLRKKR